MKQEISEREERVELFKVAATFGFLCAAMCGLAGPILLWLAPGIKDWARYWGILGCGLVALGIIICVFVCYWRAPRTARRSDQGTPSEKK